MTLHSSCADLRDPRRDITPKGLHPVTLMAHSDTTIDISEVLIR